MADEQATDTAALQAENDQLSARVAELEAAKAANLSKDEAEKRLAERAKERRKKAETENPTMSLDGAKSKSKEGIIARKAWGGGRSLDLKNEGRLTSLPGDDKKATDWVVLVTR